VLARGRCGVPARAAAVIACAATGSLVAMAGPPAARAIAGAPHGGVARDAFELPRRGCALGIGGPALDQTRSLRAARDHAFAALAAARLGVELESEVGLTAARVRERSSERTEGVLRGVWIAALRARPDGGVDAIACAAGAAGPDGPPGDAWPPGFRWGPGCGLGIAGPGPAHGDRARLAWRDAREMLARAIEARVAYVLEIDGGSRLRRSHSVRATPRAQQRTGESSEAGETSESSETGETGASLERRSWLDGHGRGPLRRPGLLYTQLCLPAAAPASPAGLR